MTPEEAIEMLRGMQNKKVDYAEMVCAPAFAYGYEYVYPEPEDYAIEEAVKVLKEVQQYREIGTVEECREAREKQKPKIPIFEHMLGEWTGKFRCPICKKVVTHDCRDTKNTFCENCGQAIQWDENLEGMEDERD